jgi:L-rhamnose isomerase/sugar isomerase
VSLGTINSNTFQDDDYKLGSLTHRSAPSAARPCSTTWTASTSCAPPGPPTSRSGSRTARTTPARTTCGVGRTGSRSRWPEIYAALDEGHRLVLEYKIFEPAFYHTDVPDWGTSYAQCVALGERAVVCLDTGHHAPSTNIEFIVMQLLRLGRLGSFDFNSRFYADDDLIVGAADPFQLFRIMLEVVRGGGLDAASGVVFMLDQCHNVERKIPGQIRSVLNVQEMTARALLVDRAALDAAQAAGDVLGAHEVVMDAFYTDVRPALADWRESRGLPRDPLAAYADSGYQDRVDAERVGGTQAGWGA